MISKLTRFLRFRAAIGNEPWKAKQRVKLHKNIYPPSRMNPCMNSEFECGGAVIWFFGPPNGRIISVKWDNGRNNRYTAASLYVYDNFLTRLASVVFKNLRKKDKDKIIHPSRRDNWTRDYDCHRIDPQRFSD